MFRPSNHLILKEIKEKKLKNLLSTVTFFLFLPALIIMLWLFVKGSSALSLDFLFMDPIEGMTAGGIFPTIVGTFWLVIISVLVACPLGVIAAIYLSEYAKDNTLTRIIRLAILNLAGVPSIVHALFGLGAFVLFLKMGTSILAASLTLSVMNLPVIGDMIFPEGTAEFNQISGPNAYYNAPGYKGPKVYTMNMPMPSQQAQPQISSPPKPRVSMVNLPMNTQYVESIDQMRRIR